MYHQEVPRKSGRIGIE